MAKNLYSPVAAYADLKRVDTALAQALTADDIRKICVADGPKLGYKAFCYLLTNRMTAEAMKPDEACETADALEQAGEPEEAWQIYDKVLAAHPDHVIALEKAKAR